MTMEAGNLQFDTIGRDVRVETTLITLRASGGWLSNC